VVEHPFLDQQSLDLVEAFLGEVGLLALLVDGVVARAILLDL